MSDWTKLVSNLVRAANSIDRLSPIEVQRLLDASIRAIRTLRQRTNIVPIPGKDAIIYIRTVAAGADRVPREEWHHALLHAAEMVRDLTVILDSGTVVRINHGGERSSGTPTI